MQQQPPEATAVSSYSPSAPRAAIPRTARRAAWAGALGTFIEKYDYLVYASLVVYIAPQFFPAHSRAASFLAGLAVLGAGYIARPFGAIIFGRVGDRRGRRSVLIWTVSLMGACSGLVGLLPTYSVIGVWAPILLTLLRLGQGIADSGEMQGAVTYAIESAPPSRRAFLASFAPTGALVGSFTGLALVWLLSSALGHAAMDGFGWRIPFLIAIPLALIVVWMRRRLEDTPEFRQMATGNEIVASPLRATLRSHCKPLLLGAAIASASSGIGGLVLWFATYLMANRQIPSSIVFPALAAAALVSALWIPVSGRMTDRFGRKRMLVGVLIAFAVLAVPMLWVLTTATSFVVIALVLIVYNGLSVLFVCPISTLLAELFPRHIRNTGSTVAVNIGSYSEGLAPFVAAQLTLAAGTGLSAAIWIGTVIVVGLVALRFVAETGGRPLR